MRAEIISAAELSDDLVCRWRALQQQNPVLTSPHFRPEFTQAVARVRPDAFVAVLDGGTAFFPFQRNPWKLGSPIGGPLSDYHGLIAPSDYRCDAADLLRACRLRSWDFDHVPAEQMTFADWRSADVGSHVIDLREGALLGSKKLRDSSMRQRRRLEDDHGPVDVAFDTKDHDVLRLCLDWKSAQYRRTGQSDLFAQPWARQLITSLADMRGWDFAGVTSVLWAGGRPIAAHFGLRSGRGFHYWFPAYDIEFRRYSPGLLLLLEMAQRAKESGLYTIDLGRGDEEYKRRLANRFVPLVEGSVAVNGSLVAARHGAAHLLQWASRLGIKRLLPEHHRRAIRRMIGPAAISRGQVGEAPRL
jgi:CelD/BcsL family acetyltransferase involved in cellulose biosynthesis